MLAARQNLDTDRTNVAQAARGWADRFAIGETFHVLTAAGSGHRLSLPSVPFGARENRLSWICYHSTKSQLGDYILFYEYSHSDNGAGLGAGHRPEWTGVTACLIQVHGTVDA